MQCRTVLDALSRVARACDEAARAARGGPSTGTSGWMEAREDMAISREQCGSDEPKAITGWRWACPAMAFLMVNGDEEFCR